MKSIRLVVSTVLLTGAVFLVNRDVVFGYAGESGSGTGQYPGAQAALRVSTHHTHLTRALAYCAGFDALIDHVNPINPLVNPQTAPLAEQIALYDELTDQGTLTGQDANGTQVTWNNFNTTNTWNYVLPTAGDFADCAGKGETMIYPVLTSPNPEVFPQSSFFDPASGWFTNRFGPWATQFHFPIPNAQGTFETSEDLQKMRDFAYGTTTVLSARSVYAFGSSTSTLWSAGCYPQRRENVPTGDVVKPGSVAAFATYLHSVGDSYSHGYCQRRWTSTTPPWVYHSPADEPAFVPGCGFNDHSWEFGCPNDERRAEFIAGTVNGAVAVYDQLLQYPHPEKKQARLPSVDAYGGWLKRQLQRYAMLYQINANSDAGNCRVSYTFELMRMCKTIAENPASACFPDVTVSAAQCADAGKTTGCDNGNSFYPMQPACTPPAAQSATAP